MNRQRVKGRRERGLFIMLSKECLNHQNYILLSPYAKQLLIDLYVNYNGKNNGDFCCTWSLMRARGWRSQSTLNNARKELLYYGWIICSRQGGKNMASLYAVTFQSIDECMGKLDIIETVTSPGTWKEPKQITWKEQEKNKSLLRDVVQLTTPPDVMVWEKPSYVM